MSDSSDPALGELADELHALEQRAQARRVRAALVVRLGAIAVAASFLFLLRSDLRYATCPATPLSLGGPLEFDLDREASQRYASIVGLPGELAPKAEHGGQHLRMFGVLSTNVVVVQNLAEVGTDPAPARNQPYSAQGRLVRDDDAEELEVIFRVLEQRGVVSRRDGHLYALYEHEAPRSGGRLPLELLGIAAFVLINLQAARRLERPSLTIT